MAETTIQNTQAATLSSETTPFKANATNIRTLESELEAAKIRYIARNPTSKALHTKASKTMPGGNTRSVLHNEPFPIYQKRGRGNKLLDHPYTDLAADLTAGLYGHSHPLIRSTIYTTLATVGISIGSNTIHETSLSSLLTTRFPIQQIRFCNSGTEANLYALSTARHLTKKRKVIVFNGAYHGGVLIFANGVAEDNVDREDWVLGTYNDVEGTRRLIETTADLAAVIVEPMLGAGGCIPASSSFLQTIQESAKAANAVFILDEVMTSRLYPSGLAGKFGLSPDLMTLGKYIGSGLAFGAFGGKKELMECYNPSSGSAIQHSGTFNNNTLAMTCGYTLLSAIYTPPTNLELNELGDYLRSELQRLGRGTKMVTTGVGAVMTVHFLKDGKTPVRAEDLGETNLPGLKKLFWFWCVERGWWVTERGMLSLILGTAREELDVFVSVVEEFVERHAEFLVLEL